MSSAQGRFTSPDAPFADQHPENPQSWNLYAYGRNNPLRYVDPTGKVASSCAAGDSECAKQEAEATKKLFSLDTLKGFGQGLWNAVTGTINLLAEGAQNLDGGQAGQFQGIPGIAATNTEQEVGQALFTGLSLSTVLFTGGTTAATGTELVQRAMSTAELNGTEGTGLLRGGREGTHFVPDAVNSSAQKAQQRLALPTTPEVRARLEVPSGTFSAPSQVKPVTRPGGGTLPGGGTERTATGRVPVKIIRVKKY